MPYFNDRIPPSCGVGRGLIPLGIAKTGVIKNNIFNNIAQKQVESIYSFWAEKHISIDFWFDIVYDTSTNRRKN